MPINYKDKTTLRLALSQQRQTLSRTINQTALNQVTRSLMSMARKLPILQQANKVLSYAPTYGEISPETLTDSLAHAQVFLPRISHYQNKLMTFYLANNPMRPNRYGISEPLPIGTPLPIQKFDVILVPLLAFDRAGNRLGMGGGYYDRALSFRHHHTSKRPILIGLAHHFQEVNSLQPDVWDVPLDVILTDQEIIRIQ